MNEQRRSSLKHSLKLKDILEDTGLTIDQTPKAKIMNVKSSTMNLIPVIVSPQFSAQVNFSIGSPLSPVNLFVDKVKQRKQMFVPITSASDQNQPMKGSLINQRQKPYFFDKKQVKIKDSDIEFLNRNKELIPSLKKEVSFQSTKNSSLLSKRIKRGQVDEKAASTNINQPFVYLINFRFQLKLFKFPSYKKLENNSSRQACEPQ